MSSKQYHFIFFVWCIFLAMNVQAQEEVDFGQGTLNELGINGNFLLDSWIIKANPNEGFTRPPDHRYLFTYKRLRAGGTQAFRMGLGFFSDTVKDTILGGGTTFFTKGKAINWSIKAGFEKRIRVAPRWLFFWGFDLLYDHSKEEQSLTYNFGNPEDTFGVSTTRQIVSPGIGLVTGGQFWLTQHLSLYTELNLIYFFSEIKEKEESYEQFYPPGPSTIYEEKFKGEELGFQAPLTFYLNLNF